MSLLLPVSARALHIPAGAERVPFAAEILPREDTMNFWAYENAGLRYIPAATVAKIFGAKIHRYNKSNSIELRLKDHKRLTFNVNANNALLGSKSMALPKPALLSPDGKEILIPLSVLHLKTLKSYVGMETEAAAANKVRLYFVQDVDAPEIEERARETWIRFRLPSDLRHYEITYHPAGQTHQKPYLAVHFPYSRLAAGQHSSGKIAPAYRGRWKALPDPVENSLVFHFPVDAAIAFGEIDATEETWPRRKLKIKITKPAPLMAASLVQIAPLKPTPPAKIRAATPTLKKEPAAVTLTPAPPAIASPRLHAGKKRFVIVLDAGHGGKDSGSTNKKGTREKDINLVMVRKIETALKRKMPDAEIILSRNHDRTLDLDSRVGIVRKRKPHIFVSIHANASKSRNKGGFEIYIPANVSSKAARAEAAGWEKTDPRRSIKIEPEKAVIRESERLAASVNAMLGKRLGRRIENRGILKGDFHVIREAGTPAVLIESGFLTYDKDARLLESPAFQETFAQATAEGIINYFKQPRK
ncbi:MAG: N-acetylmuramoyl-L-alanine amidase [Elusimicrobia bacterium]|nr:N-acetylmuramoyl-L-alanine amidase [Elusimicrobiota bacterium]